MSGAAPTRITLAAGEWRAEIAPRDGGVVRSLSVGGRPILRTMPEASDSPLDSACFPLVPYVNRIRDGRFVFQEQAFDLGATPGFEPHALHGVGWLSPWEVDEASADRAVLTLRHDGDRRWPWRFEASQRFILDEAGLTVEVEITNADARPAPAGVGLHPYFHRGDDARLTMAADRVWLSDETLIPRALVPASELADWSQGEALHDAPFVDNAYEDWDGRARVDGAGGGATLTAPGVRRAHVYAPKDADFVCVEPVTHRPDALNAPEAEDAGLVALAPGEALRLVMTIGA